MESVSRDIMLSIEDVSKSFPGVKALDSVSITINKGEVHGIVGENGAGKSTLMKILSGVYKKDAGTIVFDGQTIEKTTPSESLKLGLSIIYQEFSLINSLSVGENIYLGRYKEAGGLSGSRQKAEALLKSIGSHINPRSIVDDLSAAEKQMVEITKALSLNAKVIIMDEPSSSLATEELKNLFTIIRNLKEKGVTIIYISHKLDEIFELCDRVSVMRDGHVISTRPIAEVTRNDMIREMVGRPIENEYPPKPQCVGGKMLEIRHIRTRKLQDISFDLNSGEILGFVGLVGAGRTEIVRAIFGADKAMDLEMYLDGKKLVIHNPIDARNAGFGLIPEDRKTQGLVLPFSVEENIIMASLYKFAKMGFLKSGQQKKVARHFIDTLHIKTPSSKTKTSTLSGGNQQKCILGRWLELSPRVLIMDEPTRGIDVGAKYEIYTLMKQIVEQGSSIILISSEMPEVLNMSNRVLTICDGRITGEFDPALVTASEIMEKALD